MHNLTLTEEQAMIRDTVRKLVQDVIEPKALEHDEHETLSRAGFDALAELGMFAAAVPEEHGGAGLGLLSLVVALEEVARACGSTARLLLSQGGQCCAALAGTEAGAGLFESLATGAVLGAFVGPEHCIVATAADDGFVLEGTAEYVTAAAAADVLVVCAWVDDTPVLLRSAPDAVQVEPLHALGYRAAAPGRIIFGNARIAADAVLARGDEAAAAFERARRGGQIGGAAIACGSALASVEFGRRHTEERIAFGKPLARQQAVGHKLIDSRRRAEAARHLTWHAARLADLGEDATEAGSFARLSAVEAALIAADESIQVHGGYGFTVEYHVERHYRDAKTLEVLEGGAMQLRDTLAARMAAQP